jgi:hypothetical protein
MNQEITKAGIIGQSAFRNLKSEIDPVPVVQRIERRFPKGNPALLHQFADVVSSAQMTVFKPVEVLLRSSRVITSLHISICPGDTKGDTNFSTISCACPLVTSRTQSADHNHGKPFFNAEVSLR